MIPMGLPLDHILGRAADEATRYLASLDERPVAVPVTPSGTMGPLPGPLPERGMAADAILDELVAASATGVVASGSPRYFGFVIGGGVPAAVDAFRTARETFKEAGA